ncbi:hypothetical protein [Pseudoalteromonas phage PH357]|nr:hypothetical protein [Pseudoalteromonas phage PH357]
MTKTEQLISMIENYEDVLEENGTIDEIILYVSEKIYEANESTANKGWSYLEDDM